LGTRRTPRRSTSAISAGSTAIRPTCTSCRRRPRPRNMSSWRAERTRCWRRRGRRSIGGSTAGWPRS
jgi:hypothetical protein